MDYQFKPLGTKCAATGADLAPGEVCYSVLVERDGELMRLDYSEAGWTAPPPGTVGVWKCLVPQPVSVRREPLDHTALMNCFEQLVEDASPARERLRYVLALLLLQKRRLRLEGSRTDGADEYLQLAGSQGEGAYEVRDMQLSEQEMHDVQQELNAYLAVEWGEPVGPAGGSGDVMPP